MKYLFLLIITMVSLRSTAQLAITMPAEYEKNDGVIVTWPYAADFDTTIADISGYAAASGDVWIIYNPDSTVTDTTDIRSFLQSTGNNHSNIFFVPAYTNTFFTREYAPVMGYGVFDELLVRYLGDPVLSDNSRPADDSVPQQLANFWQTDYVPYSLVFESGNILIDGATNGFASDYILQENAPLTQEEIKQQLSDIFSVPNFTFLEAPKHSGGGAMRSLDMFMKLLDAETMLVTELPDSLPDYQIVESNIAVIEGMSNVYESPYKIVRIKPAPLDNGGYDTTLEGELRSYTNALILNNLVLIPSYNNPQYDSAAFNIYKDNTYGMTIKMIDAVKLASVHAAIHTITKERPQEHYLRISHQKVEGWQEYEGDEFVVSCLAVGDDIIDYMWLYYRFNDDTLWHQTPIHLVCPTYYGVIEDVHQNDVVHYYLEAATISGSTTSYPLSSPVGNFTFWFDITGVEKGNKVDEDVMVSPNPATDFFKVTGLNGSEEVPYKLIDAGGRLVDIGVLQAESPVRLKQFIKQGLYFLVLQTKSGEKVLKLIKK